MSDKPRMLDNLDGLDGVEAELDKLEAKLDREDREFFGEPEPKSWTTEQTTEELGKVGIDVAKFKLPARSWTADEMYEALKKNGVTGDSFQFPKPKPQQTDLQRLAHALYGRK
jgi:hypothetical protein